jgi:diaminopimelate epimerase
MDRTIPFTKMHGLGNDFVVLDGIRHPCAITREWVCQMADRHLGIGFDQLLLIERPPLTQPHADFGYRIFNADGSEVSQCGNGARCVGQFLYETGLVAANATRIVLATQERCLEIQRCADGQITVNMGVPIFDPEKVPYIRPLSKSHSMINLNPPFAIKQFLAQTTEFLPPFGIVNLGNPHVVLRVEEMHAIDIETWGKKIGADPAFPEGVNVGFMQVIHAHHIALRVYERGAGETWACGSGACAAVVIGRLHGWLDAQVNVGLRGGNLEIHWPGESHSVWMKGPAKTVFRGEYTHST